MNPIKTTMLTTLPLLLIASCLVMAWVETALQPGYFGKSAIKIVCFACLPLAYCCCHRPRISLDFCRLPKGKALRHCLLWGAGVYGGILLAYFIFATFIDLPTIAALLQENLSVNKENFLFVAVYISLVNSFLEEFFFRGMAYFPFVPALGKGKAALFSAAAFSLYHVAILLGWFSIWLFLLILLGLFIAGLFFLWLDEQYDTILCSWLVHGCANLAINTVGFIMFGIL